jgi:hypothetical protein
MQGIMPTLILVQVGLGHATHVAESMISIDSDTSAPKTTQAVTILDLRNEPRLPPRDDSPC